MTDTQTPSSSRESNGSGEEAQVFSLLDLLLVVARGRRLILSTVGIFLLIGLGIVLLSAPRYTSSAKLIREAQSEQTSLRGLSSLGRGLGLELGGSEEGLTAEAYPEIVRSREVRLSVARDTLFVPAYSEEMTFTTYTKRERSFLSRVLENVYDNTIGLFTQRRSTGLSASGRQSGAPQSIATAEEERAIRALSEMVSVQTDNTSGIMTVSVTTANPSLSAQLAESFVSNLTHRVQAFRTQKTRENLQFVRDRFEEAGQELREAEEVLAAFMDRNQNIQSAKLQTERERLQRQVRFKSQLYSDLQAQVTQAELDLQRSIPVITLVEEPVPPVEQGGPGPLFILIGTAIFGVLVGVLGAFILAFMIRVSRDEEESRKLQEIVSAFTPRPWRQKARTPDQGL